MVASLTAMMSTLATVFTFTAVFGQKTKSQAKNLLSLVDLRGARVLVVDDKASSRKIMQAMLESLSFQVTAVSSGKEVIEELEKNENHDNKPYKMVILDNIVYVYY